MVFFSRLLASSFHSSGLIDRELDTTSRTSPKVCCGTEGFFRTSRLHPVVGVLGPVCSLVVTKVTGALRNSDGFEYLMASQPLSLA